MVPVLFLNSSLGTPLLPQTIETQDFEMALGKADDKTLLNKWYSLDARAQPPCYRLRPTTCHIPGLKVRPRLSRCVRQGWLGQVSTVR